MTDYHRSAADLEQAAHDARERQRLIAEDIERVKVQLRESGLDADALIKNRRSLEYLKRATVPFDWLD